MDRVVVTKAFMNIVSMQVCAVSDATDEEILDVCNKNNPSGTSNGWAEVVRFADEENIFKTENKLPVVCADDEERRHFVVLC